MTMPARRRTSSSSGRSPRPPSDLSPQLPRRAAVVDPSETADPDDGAPPAAVYRVRNFSTKSGSVVNRGDSIKVRRGPKAAAAAAENGSARAVRRLSSDSATRDRRDAALSRQESRAAAAEFADGDGLSPSAVGASLLPDEQDDGRFPGDVVTGENGAADTSRTGRQRRNVEDPADVYKVLVLGSQGVGKTTLVEQLMTSEYLANKDSSYMGKSLPRHLDRRCKKRSRKKK